MPSMLLMLALWYMILYFKGITVLANVCASETICVSWTFCLAICICVHLLVSSYSGSLVFLSYFFFYLDGHLFTYEREQERL